MILEFHNSLLDKAAEDDSLQSHIHILERSIEIIDDKIEEFKNKKATSIGDNSPSKNNRTDDSMAA